jgi:hypothetical protein
MDSIYFAGSRSSPLLAAMALSNQTAASYSPPWIHVSCALPRELLNRQTPAIPFKCRPFLLFKTNSLMR